MLRHLSIQDFVIVDSLELDFSAGFGALTGETGAGKSILLDALGLVMGDRAESGVVRAGQKRADISAEFDLPDVAELHAWFDEQMIDIEDGVVLLRRAVDAAGRSKAWINGASATLAQLREIGEWLADVHGQHAHHALLRADAQRALIDRYAGLESLASDVADAWRSWQAALKALHQAAADAEGVQRERELLGWQVKELDELAFRLDEWDVLNQEHARLSHAAGLIEGASMAIDALEEGEAPVVSSLERLSARLGELAMIDSALTDAQEMLNNAAIQADEALHALRGYRDRLDVDPGQLTELDARIAAVTDVARKHHVAPEELESLHERLSAQLEALTEAADPAKLQARVDEAETAYRGLAQGLSDARAPIAAQLSEQVSTAMQTLSMSGGRFEVTLSPEPEGSAHGNERVEFLVAANPSQVLKSLAKTASGGELSRIGLAIQVITSRAAATPTMIFDEVDVGIGGRVAEIVGRMLHELGQQRQVMCVTHLPQVAACADWQWSIAKSEVDGETISRVTLLDEQARVDEIARMLGGVEITDTTRQHAAEMLGRQPA